MTLKEKLDLLNLSEKEQRIVENKLIGVLNFVGTDEDFNDKLIYLKSQGIKITKAKELRVLTLQINDLTRNFSVLAEIHETEIYKQNPLRLVLNPVDIYKRINYCKQNQIKYIKDDGSYAEFLFKESLWREELNKKSDNFEAEKESIINDDLVTVEPVFNINSEPVVEETFNAESIEPIKEEVNDIHVDINEYINNASNDIDELEAKTTSFAAIKDDLQAMKERLSQELESTEDLNTSNDNVIGFDQWNFEPETYDMNGMGRTA